MAISEAADVINCSPGRKPCTLMRFALCRGEESIDGFDVEYLDLLGFVVGKRINQSVPADEKYFIHCCCDNGSLLSNPIMKTSMKVIDITKERNFTDKLTANDIIRSIKSPGDVVTAPPALVDLPGKG